MTRVDDVEISKAIVGAYHELLLDRLVSDVVIVRRRPLGHDGGHPARQGRRKSDDSGKNASRPAEASGAAAWE